MERFARNRDFQSFSAYIRFLVRNDIQEQIGSGKLKVVPNDD